jgi:hypothetical protein
VRDGKEKKDMMRVVFGRKEQALRAGRNPKK